MTAADVTRAINRLHDGLRRLGRAETTGNDAARIRAILELRDEAQLLAKMCEAAIAAGGGAR